MNPNQYKIEFLEASERANRFGYKRPDMSNFIECDEILVGETFDSLLLLVGKKLSSTTPEVIAGNCLNVNRLLYKCIEEDLNLQNYFTLGYIKIEGKTSFEFTEEDLSKWIKYGIPNFCQINMHAWLTFESLEILDTTLPTSFALSNNMPNEAGGIIHGYPKDLYGDLSFHPVILGSDVLFDIGLPTISML
jgi:hypothetical protein